MRPVDDRRIVIAVAGDLDLATAPALKSALIEWLARGYCEVVLDLSDVGHMDSTGLGILIGLRERVKAGGTLTLAGAPPSVLRVLDLTGLTGRFRLAATIEDVVGPRVEPSAQRGRGGLTVDAQIALGLLATALPFAESRRAEAERWLRVLQAHGDTARIMRELGVHESAEPAPRPWSVDTPGASERDRGDPIERVIERAHGIGSERGVNVIGTMELLAAVIDVYGSDFDEVLAGHGRSRGAVRRRIDAEPPTG